MTREFDMGDGSPPRKGEVQDLRGGHGRTLEYLLGGGLPLMILVGTIIWGVAQFAKKDSVDAIRDDVWRLRLETSATGKDMAQIRDMVGDLKSAVGDLKAQQTQLLNQAPRRSTR